MGRPNEMPYVLFSRNIRYVTERTIFFDVHEWAQQIAKTLVGGMWYETQQSVSGLTAERGAKD